MFNEIARLIIDIYRIYAYVKTASCTGNFTAYSRKCRYHVHNTAGSRLYGQSENYCEIDVYHRFDFRSNSNDFATPDSDRGYVIVNGSVCAYNYVGTNTARF